MFIKLSNLFGLCNLVGWKDRDDDVDWHDLILHTPAILGRDNWNTDGTKFGRGNGAWRPMRRTGGKAKKAHRYPVGMIVHPERHARTSYGTSLSQPPTAGQYLPAPLLGAQRLATSYTKCLTIFI